ncbi:MAG: hypothetical protein KFF73_07480 [Cyclobacteriaceae bacterium]|nr:hypothetical protein [Cyclobacteriaceae bacterium]
MDSKRIIELIKFPASHTPKEQEELQFLCEQYPYSALLKIINAKIVSLNHTAGPNKFITSAAIATVDRINLKNFMQAGDWEVSTIIPDQEKRIDPHEEIQREVTADDPESMPENKITTTPVQVSGWEEDTAEKTAPGQPEEKETEIPIENATEINVETETETPEEKETDTAIDKETEFTIQQETETPADREPESPEIKSGSAGVYTGEAMEKEEEKEDQDEAGISKEEKAPKPAGKAGKSEMTPEKPATGIKIPAKPDKPDKKGKKQKGQVDLTDNKFEPLSPVSTENESGEILKKDAPIPDPLTSDLLKNIQEYRKNRDFFEKMLNEDDQDKVTGKPENPEDHLKQKAGKKAGKKAEKTIKKDKNKKSDPEDPELKKNAKRSGQKSREIERSTGGKEKHSPEDGHGADPVKPEADKSQPEEAGKENRGELPGERNHLILPTEIPDEDLIAKETEEQKLEVYEVYEEEDPMVIKAYLEKISKEHPEPPVPKKMIKEEQVRIIENFIRTEPRIKNVKTPKTLREREDLSLPSVKFKDDIISENLANIMKSQGKTEQAIDIYKKLIWKFPQKKTYFASQIEELKKKSGN